MPSKRWFVEISPLGPSGTQPINLCLDAFQWQQALRDTWRLIGMDCSLDRFSIELQANGTKAVDPISRLTCFIRKAPDDAPLNKEVSPSDLEALTSRTSMMPTAAKRNAASQAASKDRSDRGKLAPTPNPPIAAGPSFRTLVERKVEASDSCPITYREYAFGFADGCTEDEAKRFLYKRWELAKQELANTRTAKFVNLAVFDYVFEDKPTRRPIVTLAWKDWKKEPEIAFPASVTPIQPSQERVFERPRVVGITPTDSGSDAGFDAGPDAGPDAGSDAVDAATTEAAATTQAPDAPADTADTTDAADAVPNETRDASTADSTADSDASVEQPTAEEKPVGPFAKETRPSLPRTMGAPSQSAFAPSAFAQKQNLRVKDQQRPPEPFPLAGAAPPKTETRPSVEQTSATATPTQPFEPARDLDAIEAKSPTADSLDQNAPAPRMSSPRLSSPQFSSPRLSSPQWSQPKIAQIKTAETKTAETKTADTNMPEPRVSRPSITMSKREPFAPAKSPSNFAAKSPARPDGSPQPEQRTTRPDTATPKREPAPIAGQTGGPGPRVYRPSVTGVSAVATKREPASQATSTESTPEPAMDPTMEPKPRLSQTMPAARTVPTSRTLPSMTLSRAMPATGSATGSQDANAAKTTQQPSPRVSRLGPLTSNRETSAPKKPQVIEPRPRASVAPLPTRREPTLGVNRASTASLEARPRPSTIGQFSPQRKGHAVPGNQANSAADDANSDADNSANNESRDSSAGDNT